MNRLIFPILAWIGISSLCSADDWKTLAINCDRGASYSISSANGERLIVISLGKSSSEEIFKIRTNSSEEITSVLHLVRFYKLSDEQTFEAHLSKQVKITKITFEKDKPLQVIDVDDGIGNQPPPEVKGEELAARGKDLLRLVLMEENRLHRK